MQATTSKTSILKAGFCLALSAVAADAFATNTAQMPRGRSSAAGIDATITLLGVPVADVLPTPMVADGHRIANYSHNDSMPLVNSGGISATSMTVSTSWSNNAGVVSTTSASQVDNAGVSVAGLVTLGLANVDASASVTGICPAGVDDAANVSIGSLTLSVLGLPVSLGALPNPIPPNYAVTVPPTAGIVGASIVLNEQVTNGDGSIFASLDVNAAHVELDLLNLLGQATHVSLVVGSASAKADCRTDGIFEDGLNDDHP